MKSKPHSPNAYKAQNDSQQQRRHHNEFNHNPYYPIEKIKTFFIKMTLYQPTLSKKDDKNQWSSTPHKCLMSNNLFLDLYRLRLYLITYFN